MIAPAKKAVSAFLAARNGRFFDFAILATPNLRQHLLRKNYPAKFIDSFTYLTKIVHLPFAAPGQA